MRSASFDFPKLPRTEVGHQLDGSPNTGIHSSVISCHETGGDEAAKTVPHSALSSCPESKSTQSIEATQELSSSPSRLRQLSIASCSNTSRGYCFDDSDIVDSLTAEADD